jgi:N-methylhydantoinase A/oxoprolinase/acetone carboxylase beta subunit
VQYPSVAVFERSELGRGQQIDGPALIVETMATTFVDEGWRATADSWGHLHVAADPQDARPTTA